MKNQRAIQNILFLCSDNYFLSRFAENYFNSLALEQGLDCWAESRGFQIRPNNVQAISQHAVRELERRGISIAEPFRYATVVQDADFEFFDSIIVINEEQSWPPMLANFTGCPGHIETWTIAGSNSADPSESLSVLECKVRTLVERLWQL